MSVPEYHQKAEDHQAILLLIKNLNSDLTSSTELTKTTNDKFSKLFDSIYDQLINVNVTKINGNLNYERTIKLRFKKNYYELSNNEWGDFQAHRKLFGLITIGILDELKTDLNGKEQNANFRNEVNQVEEIYEKHKTVADTYSTLLDSRCLLLRINSLKKIHNDSIIETKLEDEDQIDDQGDFIG